MLIFFKEKETCLLNNWYLTQINFFIVQSKNNFWLWLVQLNINIIFKMLMLNIFQSMIWLNGDEKVHRW